MNIVNKLQAVAKKHPEKIALKFPKRKVFGGYSYQEMNFETLNTLVDSYAASFEQLGITKGIKTVLFVKPRIEFTALVFALFKVGAIPVLIDPGMGRGNLLRAIKSVAPQALVAVPLVHLIRLFFTNSFASINHFVTTGWLRWGKMKTISQLAAQRLPTTSTCQLTDQETAAILFTSGGTGIPKGVVYTHKIFQTQTNILQELFNLGPEEVDLPGFPLFSLFTVTMGMTSCAPDMNPAKPAQACGRRLVQNINDAQATFVAGSPAIWERVADYCIEKNIVLPSIKYLVMFGAPVSNQLHLKFQQILVNGTTYTPYGATESLPVSSISGKYILEHTAALTEQGKGTCIGKPVPATKVKVIPISDDVINDFSHLTFCAPDTIGEIIVSGDVVTKKYFNMEQETLQAKIIDSASDELWHRIGDLGYFDQQGMLWFCGRKTHRVELAGELLCSVMCEAVFNSHPLVKRTALVGPIIKGQKYAGLVIETVTDCDQQKLISELKTIASQHVHTQSISLFELYSSFPVDIRHNIKIDRTKLTAWVEQKHSQGHK